MYGSPRFDPGAICHFCLERRSLGDGVQGALHAERGCVLAGGMAENTDYFVRRIEGTNYFYLFDTYYDAIAKDGSTPACWLWQTVRKITNAGSGTVTAVNQDPAWTNLAYQELTTSNKQYGLYNTSMGTLVPWSTFLVRLIEAPSVSVLSIRELHGQGNRQWRHGLHDKR